MRWRENFHGGIKKISSNREHIMELAEFWSNTKHVTVNPAGRITGWPNLLAYLSGNGCL